MTTARRRPAAIAAGTAALLALAALTAGLPAVLYLAAGSPLPQHLPGISQAAGALTRPDNGTLFLAVLRDLGWIAWAAWTASAAAEILAQARGRRAPRLAGLSGMQGLARTLITAVMIAFSSGTAALPAVTAVSLASWTAHSPAAHQPHAARTVTVRPGDCLWLIAARTLGNGDRYPEIAALNYGRPMGRGAVFTSAASIRAGWRLALPPAPRAAAADTSADRVHARPDPGSTHHSAHPSARDAFAVPHASAAPASGTITAMPAPQGTPDRDLAASPAAFAPAPAAATAAAAATQGSGGDHLSPVGLFAAGLLAGGIIVVLARLRHGQRQRRRPGRRISLPASREARRAERAIRTSPAADRAALIRAALAALAAGLRDSGQPVPAAAGIHADDGTVDILLTEPGDAPPAPFTAVDGTGDLCWRVTAGDLGPRHRSPGTAGSGDLFPGLVTAGNTAAGGQLLLDLEAAGVTGAAGPGALADRYLVTAASELATNPWAGSFDLLLEGFPELAAASPRAQACATLDDAITILETRARMTGSETGAARQNRLADPACPDWTLTLLAARTVPSPGQMARLLDAAAPGSGIAALVPGTAGPSGREAPASLVLAEEPGGGTTATVRPSGLVIWPALLDDAGYRVLAEIFAAGTAADVPATAAPYDSAPAAAPAGDDSDDDACTIPLGPPPSPAPADGAAQLRVSVIGPPAVTGTVSDLQPKQAELVCALALAGAPGLSSDTLRTYLGADEDHPKPPDSLRQVITRTRRRLGPAPGGGEYIIHSGGSRYRLHPAAVLDWDEFRRLAARGRDARDPAPLRQALATVRGEPLDGAFWWWLEEAIMENIRAEIVDAAALLAGLEMDAGDPGAAGRAARAGLAADTAAEQLWRAVMRAEHGAGNTAGVHDAWRHCLAVISEIAADGEPHPDTARLYRELTAGKPQRTGRR